MKKLFLLAAVASMGFTNDVNATDGDVSMGDVPTQIEAVVEDETVTIVEEVPVEVPQNTMQPLAANDKPVIAVFYADWCGSCKILEPRLNAAMDQLADKDALKIVKFDLTDDTTKAKAASMAGENGLTDLYNDNAPKTGFALLVNNGSVDSVTLTKKDSIAEIKAKLENFIAASQS